MMRRQFLFLLMALVITIAPGCPGIRPSLTNPPGPIAYQQYNATVHDPYVDQDLGPEVVGGRPRDFQEPRAEAVRNRPFGGLWP